MSEGSTHNLVPSGNAVAPGIIQTWFIDQSPEQFEREKTTTPLRRFGTADEVADVIWFLVSSQSSFVTGSDMLVDGGFTAI